MQLRIRDLKIKYKIILLIGMNVIFMSLVWLFIQLSLNSLRGEFENLTGGSIRRNSLLLQIRNSFGYGGFIHHFKNYILRGHDKDKAKEYSEKFKQSKIEMELAIRKFSQLPGLSEKDKTAINDIKKVKQQYVENFELAQKMKAEGYSIEEIDKAVHISDTIAFSAFTQINQTTRELQKEEVARIGTLIRNTWSLLILILLAIIIIMAAANYLLFNLSIITPLKNFNNNLIKGNSGDLNISIDESRKDEIGEMSHIFNQFIKSLKMMLGQVKDSVHQTKGVTTSLEKASEDSSTSLEEIRSNIESMLSKIEGLDSELSKLTELTSDMNSYSSRVSEAANSQAADINDSSASIEQMASSIQSVARTTEEKMETVAKLSEMASSGEKEMAETIKIIKNITQSTNLIMSMLAVINKIANETNLLAMNAAIEAAHAGDAGRGFAVVADEIRQLSEDTSNHSREISNSLKDIIEYIHVSETAATRTGSHLTNIVKGVSDVSNGMLEVKNSMGELSSGSGQILTALSSLIASSNDVKDSSAVMSEKLNEISQSFNKVSLISKDNKQGMAEVTNGVNEIFNSVLTVSEAGKKNMTNIEGLEKLVNRFKT